MRMSRFALSLLIVVAAMATLFAQAPAKPAKPIALTVTSATTAPRANPEPSMQQSLQ